MKKTAPGALSSLLAACSTLSGPGHDAAEVTYQVLNAVDYAQTVQTARGPLCYNETDPITSRVIGEHPSTSGVAAMWAAQSIAHYAVSAWLDREIDATDSRAWHITRGVWHVLTIANAGYNVVHNYNQGLRPFGSGRGCDHPVGINVPMQSAVR